MPVFDADASAFSLRAASWVWRISFLARKTEYPFTVQDMIAYLERQGISAERKSIYDDLELLELYGILHCLFLGSKNGNSKVPRSNRFWYSKKPSPSHLSNFTCWRFLEKKMNTAPPSGGSSISVLTI